MNFCRLCLSNIYCNLNYDDCFQYILRYKFLVVQVGWYITIPVLTTIPTLILYELLMYTLIINYIKYTSDHNSSNPVMPEMLCCVFLNISIYFQAYYEVLKDVQYASHNKKQTPQKLPYVRSSKY